jgi:hypothetical protein
MDGRFVRMAATLYFPKTERSEAHARNQHSTFVSLD